MRLSSERRESYWVQFPKVTDAPGSENVLGEAAGIRAVPRLWGNGEFGK